jgi:hypothetical protein
VGGGGGGARNSNIFIQMFQNKWDHYNFNFLINRST